MSDKRDLEWAKMHNVIVHTVLKTGGSTTDCIIALIEDRDGLIKETIRLQEIAPHKVTMPDGKVAIYRCPDELIPEIDIR